MGFEQSNLWQASCEEQVLTAPLSDEIMVDLAIIGGGFTGCSAALEAAQSGARVAVLEAQKLGYGGSGRNVGLVNAGLWLPPDDVVKQLGPGVGKGLISSLGEGPQIVFDLISRHGICCEATRNGTLHLAHSPAGLKELQRRYAQGNRFGAPLQLIDAEEVKQRTGTGIYYGALFDPRAGTVQPLAYCLGLARAAVTAGADIYENTPVRQMTHDGELWRITTDHGSLRAQAVLLATNAYFSGVSSGFRPEFVPVHYSQFATGPLPQAWRDRILSGGEGCWDTALVMSSFRVDQAGRLILGGIGDVAGPGGAVHSAWARRKVAQVFPDLVAEYPEGIRFEHAWQGKIAMTGDHIPKAVSFGPNALAVFGYSGRGISPGTVFGKAAARYLVQGEQTALPVPVQRDYHEAFVQAKSAYYEFGAVAAHCISPLPFAAQKQRQN